MPDRLPRGLRALHALVRFGAVEPHRPVDVIDRLCDELEVCFDLVGVRSLSPESELGRAAVGEGRAIATGDQVVVPLLAQGRVLGCVRGEAAPASAMIDLDLLSTIGHVAAVLVQKAERDEELDLVLRQLRRADRAKTEFVSTASHELRGPVAIVGGIASTLDSRAEELEPEQLRQLHSMLHEQSVRLRDLIEQLLDLSRIESGSISVQRQPLALREWLELLLLRLVPDQLADIDVQVDPAVEIETDGYAFERVVGNLIVNALRHGQPPVRVRSRIGDSLCLCVEDSGYGVPPDFVPQLFERFSRSAASRRSDTNGVGLGLSIARSYAEALGASLYYEAAEPRGARFVVELHDVTPAPQHSSTSRLRSG